MGSSTAPISPLATATATGSTATISLRPRISARERSNSFRRKASIDSETGQPHHYDHHRHHHHDPTKGRSPSPPNGEPPASTSTAAASNADRPHLAHHHYNADGILVPTRRTIEQSWSSFLIQHQLVLSGSVILATFASHVLIVSKEYRDGHKVDWIGSLSAMIPPPIWQNLPLSWTLASRGGPAMVKKWIPKPGTYNPNDAWSSTAMALQYPVVREDGVLLYGKGWNDLYMVMVWVMIWTAIREAVMTFVLIPMGTRCGVGESVKKSRKLKSAGAEAAGGGGGGDVEEDPTDPRVIERKKLEHARDGKLLRFAEQGWLVLYDGCMWSFGMYLLYNSEYWKDTSYYWRDYPKTELDATMKWYYLVQFAFWLQQLLLAILGIEKRRKDFLEFMIHHIITCLLVGFSYSFNLTSVGHAVLCAMDFSDIVLSACKMLKYMHKDQLADVGFVFFVVTWILSRHYYFGVIIWSVFVEAPKYANSTWDPAKGLFFTENVRMGFQFLLCALYGVLLFWLVMIARVVAKVLKGENSEDVRSEDEEEEEEVETQEKEKVQLEKRMQEQKGLFRQAERVH